MRNYACHRLYISPDHYLKQAFVSLDEQGRVVRYASFQEEIVATDKKKRIGGIIILSDTLSSPCEDFHAWLVREMKSQAEQTHAWHLSDFDFTKEKPTGQSILRRL